MGRIFLSQRLGVRATAERWRRLGRDLCDRDQGALDWLAGMATAHASEAFYALDDPLEAAVLGVLLELEKGGGRAVRLRPEPVNPRGTGRQAGGS